MDTFIRIIKKIADNGPESVSFLLEIADMYSFRGDFERAVGIREELIGRELPPELKETILFSLAADFHKAGMCESAVNTLETVLTVSADKDKALDMLSHISAEINEWEKVVDYQKTKKVKDEGFIVYALCQWARELIGSGNLKGGMLKLKEAGMIIPDDIHIKLHYADVYLNEKRLPELLKLGDEISKNHKDFYGILIKKVLETGSYLKDFLPHVLSHLSRRPGDVYTVYVFSCKLIELKKYKDALNFLKKFYTGKPFNPYVLRLYIRCLNELDKDMEHSCLRQVEMLIGEPEKWFRCQSCGYETENFSFACMRCGKLDNVKSIW